jgi:FAD/FMN-containing dehydrogenase
MLDATARPPAPEELRAFGGTLIAPGDAGYDEARTVFNAMIDKRPALIARCRDVEDVKTAIAYARRHALPVAVRCGGHSVTGASVCDGGVVVDLGAMNAVTVDVERGTARVGGGSNWGNFDRALQPHGLATTGGRASTTGVGGFTLGGGSGWLERAHGLACDNVISLQVVTADGELLRVSDEEHPDLFWALRGGGGNYGVVTEFEFRVHSVGEHVYGGLLVFDAERGADVMAALRGVMDSAPEQLGAALAYLTAPPVDALPQRVHGSLVTGTVICWNGDPETGAELIEPLRAIGPIADHVEPVAYADLQCSIDNPPGFRGYWTAEYLRELSDDAISTIEQHSLAMPLGESQSLLVPWGGAIARVPEDATPLAQRDAAWVVHPYGSWAAAEEDAAGIAWARSFRAALKPYATGGIYLNFIGDEGEDRVRAAFGPEKYDRMAAIKHRYDPEGVFRGNQAIRPRAAA